MKKTQLSNGITVITKVNKNTPRTAVTFYLCLENQEKKALIARANGLLHYQSMIYFKNNGYKIYDFGGISGNFDKNDPHYGIYGFKKAFKGYIVEYVGEFDLVINKFYYTAYKIAYKCYKNLRHIIGKIKKW